MLYSGAERRLRQAGLLGSSWGMLNRTTKRRFQPKPGRGRRKYWYIKQEAFDHILQEAKAGVVEAALDEGTQHV